MASIDLQLRDNAKSMTDGQCGRTLKSRIVGDEKTVDLEKPR
jgi:hypothetical protein